MTNKTEFEKLSEANDLLRARIAKLELERDQLETKYKTSVAQVRRVQVLNETLLRRVESALIGINAERTGLPVLFTTDLSQLRVHISKLEIERDDWKCRAERMVNTLEQAMNILCRHSCDWKPWIREAENIVRAALANEPPRSATHGETNKLP